MAAMQRTVTIDRPNGDIVFDDVEDAIEFLHAHA